MSNRFSYVKFAVYNGHITAVYPNTKAMLKSIYASDVEVGLFRKLNRLIKFKQYMQEEGSVLVTSDNLLALKGYNNIAVFDEKHPLFNLDLLPKFQTKHYVRGNLIRELLSNYMSTVKNNVIQYEQLK
jgi:hypothetical protein